MAYRMAPLPGTFMLTSIIGFFVVATYTISGRIDATWGFSFALVFVLMFISSVISISPSFPAHPKSADPFKVSATKNKAQKRKKRKKKAGNRRR